MYYLIKESLVPCDRKAMQHADAQYVAVLTTEEWQRQRDGFDMVIDMEMDAPQETKAVVNMDSLTGSLSIPDRKNISGPRKTSRLPWMKRVLCWWTTAGMCRKCCR